MSALAGRAFGASTMTPSRMRMPMLTRHGLQRMQQLQPLPRYRNLHQHLGPDTRARRSLAFARPYTTGSSPEPRPSPSVVSQAIPPGRRRLRISVYSLLAGFVIGVFPLLVTVYYLRNPPTSEETLSLVKPQTPEEQRVDEYMRSHPLAIEMRSRPGFVESRPHMKIPDSFRAHSLTGGTLMGPGKMVVPPLAFAEEGGKSLVSLAYLGKDLCGHPGIVHGGLLATLLDEGLARCCFAALPHKVGVTATLDINYRAPARSDSYVVLRAVTTKVEGRKAWVEGRIETLVGPDEKPTVLAEATALFVSPKHAAMMAKIYSPD